MEDSCYEESEFEESSGCDEYESDLHSDSDNAECSNSKSVGLDSLEDPVIVFETQDDVGQSSTQIPKQPDPPLVEGEPSINEEDTILIPYKGQTFGTWEEAKAFYIDYAGKVGFGVRTRDSRRDRARDNSITRITFTCDREGRHVPKVKPQDPEKPVVRRNTSTQKCGCMARFVVVVRKDGRWVVSDFHMFSIRKEITKTDDKCRLFLGGLVFGAMGFVCFGRLAKCCCCQVLLLSTIFDKFRCNGFCLVWASVITYYFVPKQ